MHFIDLPKLGPIIILDIKEDIEFTVCRGTNNCSTYTKKYDQLTETELNLLKGEAEKQLREKSISH